MTGAVVKRTEGDLAGWLGTEAGFVSGLCSFDGEPVVLEPYQLAFLQNRPRFRWVAKSRQVGYSFLFALEALARCHLGAPGQEGRRRARRARALRQRPRGLPRFDRAHPALERPAHGLLHAARPARHLLGNCRGGAAQVPAPHAFDSLGPEDFQQELEAHFVDESYSFYPYELILPCTSDDLVLYDDPADVPKPEGRLVAGFDVGRTHDRSELALFEQQGEHFTCRLLRTFAGVSFAEQEAELRRVLTALPVDRSGIGTHLAENLGRDFPQVVGESFPNEAKGRRATDFKVLLRHRGVALPREREVAAQVHSIKRRILPPGKVTPLAASAGPEHGPRECASERAALGGFVRPEPRGVGGDAKAGVAVEVRPPVRRAEGHRYLFEARRARTTAAVEVTALSPRERGHVLRS